MNPKFYELKASGNLPSPNGVALEIIKLTQKDDTSIEDLVHPIQADPVLAGRVLKMVNTAAFNTQKKIVSLHEAIIRLGFNALSRLALTLSVVDKHRTGVCETFDYTKFWSSSLLRALAMREIAQFTQTINPQEAFTLGLIAEIGQLALAQIYPEAQGECLTKSNQRLNNNIYCKTCSEHVHCVDENSKLLLEEERDVFNIDHDQITIAMLNDWGLPNIFVDAVHQFHTYHQDDNEKKQELALILTLSSALAGQLQMGKAVDYIQELSEKVGLNQIQLFNVLSRINEEWPAWKKLLNIEECSLKTLEKLDLKIKKKNGLRILLVDDDRICTHILSTYLTQQGHTVTSAYSAEQALNNLLLTDPQVVITDYQMQPMDGIAFIKALRASRQVKWVYIILITADKNPDVLSKAFEVGVNDFIGKPLNQVELDARILGAKNMLETLNTRTKELNDIRHQAFDLAANARRFEKISFIDVLTNLPNRRKAIDLLDNEWQAYLHGKPFTLLSLDLDLFKQINDNYGHGVGDEVLMHFAKILQESLLPEQIACRMGGEEFIVIAPGLNSVEIPVLCEHIRSMIELQQPTKLNLARLVTVSIGAAISSLHMDKNGWQDTLQRSDIALYEAKAAGRNAFKIYNDFQQTATSAYKI